MHNKSVQKMAIIFIFVTGLLMGCASHVDVDIKGHYSCNKILLLAALLEEEMQKNGEYPASLEAIEKKYFDYLNKNPEIERNYLNECWWGKPKILAFDRTAFNDKIRYLVREDRKDYFLVAEFAGYSSKKFLELKYKDMLAKENEHEFIFLISACIRSGKTVRLDFAGEIKCEQVSLENVKCNMRKIKKRWLPFIFD